MYASQYVTTDLVTVTQLPQRGDVVTGLWIMEGSSVDRLEPVATDTVPQARDVLTAVPFLGWFPLGYQTTSAPDQGDAPALIAEAQGLVHRLGAMATESSLPLTQQPLGGVRFEVNRDLLRIACGAGDLAFLGEHTWAINPRLAYFLSLTNTMAIWVETPATLWVKTVANGDDAELAYVAGSLQNKQVAAIVDKSTRWRAATPGNPSLFADGSDHADDHYRSFCATRKATYLPPAVTLNGPCRACGALTTTSEHCTPNWLATLECVVPVTADIFCADCNADYFGKLFEAPIADAVKVGGLRDPDLSWLLSAWMIKTALTLSAASGVRLHADWLRDLRQGRLPGGFQCRMIDLTGDEPGYWFTVTFFSQERAKQGYHLTSFTCSRFSFVVIRAPRELDGNHALDALLTAAFKAVEAGGTESVHAHMLSSLTGHPLRHTAAVLEAASPRRSRG